jgi:hypothetical protein
MSAFCAVTIASSKIAVLLLFTSTPLAIVVTPPMFAAVIASAIVATHLQGGVSPERETECRRRCRIRSSHESPFDRCRGPSAV